MDSQVDDARMTDTSEQAGPSKRCSSRFSSSRTDDNEIAAGNETTHSEEMNATYKMMQNIRKVLECNVDDLECKLKERGLPTPKGKPDRQFLLIQHEIIGTLKSVVTEAVQKGVTELKQAFRNIELKLQTPTPTPINVGSTIQQRHSAPNRDAEQAPIGKRVQWMAGKNAAKQKQPTNQMPHQPPTHTYAKVVEGKAQSVTLSTSNGPTITLQAKSTKWTGIRQKCRSFYVGKFEGISGHDL